MKINFKDKKVAILGFGMEGKDAAKFLNGKGAQVTVFDKRDLESELSPGEKRDFGFILGGHYLTDGLKQFEIIVRSPGVYRFIDEIVEAEKVGSIVTSPTKLFFDLCPAKIIGVTGTKGKGTTASLIYEILKADGKDTYLAGNIGKSILALLPKLKKTSWVVLELSSFQLIDLHKSPNVAVVLNITSDHLDWHKDINEYIDAKKSIVRFQKIKDFKIINYDYKISKEFGKLGKSKTYYFSKRKKVNGCYVENKSIILKADGKKQTIGSTRDLKLRGEHNWENITASIAASFATGSGATSIKKAVFSFKGLEHRLQLVGEVDGVTFYNDSFGTGPQTVLAAVNSFYEPTTLILGGFDKKLDYSEMVEELGKRKISPNVILIGDIGKSLEKLFENSEYDGKIVYMGKSKMNRIVAKAKSFTKRGGVVLLSPGTSSFDMFESYKDRGDQFKKAVHNLK